MVIFMSLTGARFFFPPGDYRGISLNPFSVKPQWQCWQLHILKYFLMESCESLNLVFSHTEQRSTAYNCPWWNEQVSNICILSQHLHWIYLAKEFCAISYSAVTFIHILCEHSTGRLTWYCKQLYDLLQCILIKCQVKYAQKLFSISPVDNHTMASHSAVSIRILDVNDNPPELATPYEASICEDAKPGQVCF